MSLSQRIQDPVRIRMGQHHWDIPLSHLALIVLSILYTVGLVGILWPFGPSFIRLTPVNLLFSLFIVLLFHPRWTKATIWVLLISYSVGFGAEWFGVQTGLLFGDYAYGPVLGPAYAGTPFMIGINWMMLVYCTGVTVNQLFWKMSWIIRGVIAAFLMVGLDLLIEPVAMELDFWQWANGIIPVQNYVGWLIVALPLTLLFARFQGQIRNPVGIGLLIWQLLFFLVLNLF